MPDYSKRDTATLQEQADEALFNYRAEAFFRGEPIISPRSSRDMMNRGATDEQIAAREAALFAELDALCTDRPTAPVSTSPAASAAPVAALDDDEPTWERIDDPIGPTPHDRAFVALREAEAERAAAEPNTEEHALATGKVVEAKRRLNVEAERDGDEGWRKRRAIDEHRRTGGREEYNTGRRKVRPEPNRRPREMTVEERAAHERAQRADNKWASRMRTKNGWSEEQIAEGLAARRAKRNNPDFGIF